MKELSADIQQLQNDGGVQWFLNRFFKLLQSKLLHNFGI